MPNFWDCIPVNQRGQAYVELANYQAEIYNLKLDEPNELRSDSPRLPDIINAPEYDELSEIEIQKEIIQTPIHPRRLE